jgi:hypothetical protein
MRRRHQAGNTLAARGIPRRRPPAQPAGVSRCSPPNDFPVTVPHRGRQSGWRAPGRVQLHETLEGAVLLPL